MNSGYRLNNRCLFDVVYIKVYTAIMHTVIPVTQARRDLLKLVDKVDEEYTRVDLTKKGRVKATIVSPDYLDSLEETIYTLTHSMRDIRAAEKEVAAGKYVTLDTLLKELHAGKSRHRPGKSKKKET